jgi:hypothetical protein
MFLKSFVLCLSNRVALGDGMDNDYMKDKIALFHSKLRFRSYILGYENVEVLYYDVIRV